MIFLSKYIILTSSTVYCVDLNGVVWHPEDMIAMEKIDFVLPWVDGSDKVWIALKRKYENSTVDMSYDLEANADCRYRDYGLLKYWFRAVEQFAPWVNRVYFVTYGQKPVWLNESNQKLRLINHDEYIPADYLPTFQSNTIELNLHRIADLSERFVLFNDDVFLLRSIKPEFFFKNEQPVICSDLSIPSWIGSNYASRVILNNSWSLKLSLNVEHLVWKNIWKFTNLRALGFARAVKNLLSFAVNRTLIVGSFGHLAQPHLKSTLEEIWRVQPKIMERTSQSRFRTDDCVNQWLISAWDMISGRFYPANEKRRGRLVTLDADNIDSICDLIRKQSYPELCLGERRNCQNLELCIKRVAAAFGELLPEKSSFEK